MDYNGICDGDLKGGFLKLGMQKGDISWEHHRTPWGISQPHLINGMVASNGGFNGGTPKMANFCEGKSQSKMDDDWGYPQS